MGPAQWEKGGNANIDIWLVNPSGQCLLILPKNIFPTKLYKGFFPVMIWRTSVFAFAN